jgi:hypothetical protein
MSIAVGHHVYRDDVDAEQAAERWQAWLAGVFA